MVEEQGMGRGKSLWEWVSGSRIPVDALGVAFLGAVAYLLFSHAAALSPGEGSLLIMAAAGFLLLGLRWRKWHWGLTHEGPLLDWVQRIQQGERGAMAVPRGLQGKDEGVVAALNSVIEDVQSSRTEVKDLRYAMAREWRELDSLLEAIQRHHALEAETRVEGGARLESLGRDLKAALEGTLRFDEIELNHRLRADQFRLQGQAFQSTLEQMLGGLEQFENLLEELRDSFPRIRREEDALGRLADAGLRQGSRLTLSVKGLVAHTPRLMEGSQARMEWLQRLRQSGDGVRDLTEALARRLEGFRAETQARIQTFGGGAQVGLKELDHAAQQLSLLAVNAAILAQQEGGSAGTAAISERLRVLADQTAERVSGMERQMDEYQRGLERETTNLWDLQEVTQNLLSDVHELLRTAGHLDHQGYDLERALETHLGQVELVRQASERAELSLHEVGERALALESAHGRQWGVEAKIGPEQERLSRVGMRLQEVGQGLSRISQQNIDEIWDILARHQSIRRTEAYQQVISEGLPHLMDIPASAESTWNGVAWTRAQRRLRLAEGEARRPAPLGRQDANGSLRLLLMGLDVLHNPEPSALDGWSCDATGRFWDFKLMPFLQTESYRLALLALLKESTLTACFPGLDIRIAPEGAHLELPHPYPGLPAFLAGLGLELPMEPEHWELSSRKAAPPAGTVQNLIWMGPNQGGGRLNPHLRLIHSWLGDDKHQEPLLSWLPHDGPRPSSPWLREGSLEDHPAESFPVRWLGLGTEAPTLLPIRTQLDAAGAREGAGGMTLCAIHVGHPHPEALLLRLFQADADLAGAFHPDLVPYQVRLREDVLGGGTGDPYRAAWAILEDLQREGWLMPLPSV
jgi:hypothetical protein